MDWHEAKLVAEKNHDSRFFFRLLLFDFDGRRMCKNKLRMSKKKMVNLHLRLMYLEW